MDERKKNYAEKMDIVIVGAGAAGLFYGADRSCKKGMILDRSPVPGRKLLMSGSGSCNLTHGGSIKDFVDKYGQNGRKIRKALHAFNNSDTMKFFENLGIELMTREDGKVFPASMKAGDVRDALIKKCAGNGFDLKTGYEVRDIDRLDNAYLINGEILTDTLVLAHGGLSYPGTGSDGSMWKLLEKLGVEIVPPRPALVPFTVEKYPFKEAEGIALKNVRIEIFDGSKVADKTGDMLFTDKYLSGPVALDISREAIKGRKIRIRFSEAAREALITKGISKSLGNFLTEAAGLPKALTEILIRTAGLDKDIKASAYAAKSLRLFYEGFEFVIGDNQGYGKAMVTAGGVSLDEVNNKTFEHKRSKGLYIIGEALDIDGATGGYNLQFAFSSAHGAASSHYSE